MVDLGPEVATEYGPGAGWPEDRNILRWLENRGRFRRWRSRQTSSVQRELGPGIWRGRG